ncbi:MAG: phage regulatory CII family protein [Acetobacteraceae bacterium]|nr:hypothetical protein [Pseudomonadota bacterium]
MQLRPARGDEFSRLVYRILVTEKRRAIRDVAAAVGMEYASFHARVIGRTHFKAEEVSRLIAEVPDPRLCDYLLSNTAFVAVPRPMPSRTPQQSTFQAAVQLATESLATIAHIGETVLGGQLDTSGYEHLSNHVREAERAVSNLRAGLLSMMPRKSRPEARPDRPDPVPSTVAAPQEPAAVTSPADLIGQDLSY